MQKTTSLFLLRILLCVVLAACKTGADESNWTSMDPSSIPLATRQAEYNKGNLVPNASFENVEIGKNDSLIRDFKLTNWEVVGEGVELTDLSRKTLYDSSEVFNGKHAIKIIRTPESVQEINNPTAGVLSDYIEVLPANYDFYFNIRLEDIIPTSYLDRFQNRIDKGIDIRLKFYDAQKRELDPGIYFEYIHKNVDNSFKGFAFANFFYIDEFGWSKVRGESWVYPFSEGDMPDQCRYVKIFLGLKCSGTMWVDDVDFRLSRWSFTPVERIDSLFEKKYTLSDLLIPTPKEVANRQTLDLKNKTIRLVYNDPVFPEAQAALSLLQSRLGQIHHDSVSIVRFPTDPSALEIVLLSGHSAASSKFGDAYQKIRDKDQGYFIRRDDNRIFIGASQPKGLFYAASSLCQLIDYADARIDYADITDYPDFTGRTTLLMAYQNRWALEQNTSLTDSAREAILEKREENLKRQISNIDFYTYYKINELYSLYFVLSERWWQPGEFYKKLFREVGKRCAEYGDIVNSSVQINPYFHIAMEQRLDTLSDSLRQIFSHVTEDGFNKIKNTLKPALDAGAKTVMFCADDYVPHKGIVRGEYVLFNKEDEKKFTNLADAQSYLLNRLKGWLDKEYKGTRLEFVPPAYNNRFIDYGMGSAEVYFSDLSRRLDPSVVLVWTGNTIRSLSYDPADIRRVTDVYKARPMLWDNTPYARTVESINGGYPVNYPQKSTLCNLFEPYDIQYPENFPNYLDSRYYSNQTGSEEISKIKYMTFADFTWNTKDYNPDFSLFKALVQYVGVENAKLLLKFNEDYFQFVRDWGQLRLDIKHKDTAGFSVSGKEKTEEKIKVMEKSFEALKSIQNEALKKELEDLMKNKIAAWKKLLEEIPEKK